MAAHRGLDRVPGRHRHFREEEVGLREVVLLSHMPIALLPNPTPTPYPNLYRCCSPIVVALPLLLLPCISLTLYHTYLILAPATTLFSLLFSAAGSPTTFALTPLLLLSPYVLPRYPEQLPQLAVHYPTTFAPVDRQPAFGRFVTLRRHVLVSLHVCRLASYLCI